MTRTTTPILDTTDRDRRVLATLAQQRGNIDDVVVDDGHAPSFVVLADPEGNKACVCTCLDR